MPDIRLIKLAKFINSICNQEKEINIDSFIEQLLQSKNDNDDDNIISPNIPMINMDNSHTYMP